MKAPVYALFSLGCINQVQANKYEERLKGGVEKRVAPHKVGASTKYDSQWCLYEKINAKEGTLNQLCFDHATEVQIGWELEQTSGDDDDIFYW
jgi:hypothetical protein